MNEGDDLVAKRMTKKLRREGRGMGEDSTKGKRDKEGFDGIKELERTIRGQMNRLTSSNLPSIAGLIENLYHKNSLFQVNECVCKCINDLVIVDGATSPVKLISELALLIATLQANVGDEVAGHAIHFFISIFHRLKKNKLESKKLDNLLLLFSHLYALSVFDSTLILQLMNQLLEDFDDKSVELLLNMLISIGFILRKNSPCEMKELIRKINSRAEEAQSTIGERTVDSRDEEAQSTIGERTVDSRDEEAHSTVSKTEKTADSRVQSTVSKTEKTADSRVQSTVSKTERTADSRAQSSPTVSKKRIEFMLGTLAEIRNNNVLKVTSKCSGVILPIDKEEVRNVLKKCLKKGNRVTPLSVTYSQALSSNRWWVKVGSLKEREEEGKGRESAELIPKGEYSGSTRKGEYSGSTRKGEYSESVLESGREEELCRMLRLNTSRVRRSLFKALISSSDIVEAGTRMISISPKQTSEVTNVILQVALHESSFNPFYTHLLSRLCHFDRRFKLSTHFSLMDRIHTVQTMTQGMRNRFIQIVLHLLVMKTVSLSVLKRIQFSDLTESLVHFVKSILSGIMSHDDTLMKEIFDRIPNKDKSFATSIRLFMSCFMDEKSEAVGREMIKARIKLNQRNKLPFRPPVDQVQESSEEEEEVQESSEEEEEVQESSEEEEVQESSEEEEVQEPDEEVVRKIPRGQLSLKELEKRYKESIKKDGKKGKKQIARKRKLPAKEESEEEAECFTDKRSGTVGKGTVGKGTVGKGTVGKGTVGKGTVGKGTVGKGTTKASVKSSQRKKQLCQPVDHGRESSDEEVVQETNRGQSGTSHDQLSLKELEKKYKESIKQEDEKEKKIRKKQVAKERKLLMKEKNEDAVIEEMRKKLKLHKRRKTQAAIPRSFYTDGLGDLLDFIEKRNGSDDEEKEREENVL